MRPWEVSLLLFLEAIRIIFNGRVIWKSDFRGIIVFSFSGSVSVVRSVCRFNVTRNNRLINSSGRNAIFNLVLILRTI